MALSFLRDAESNPELSSKIEVAFDKASGQWQQAQLIALATEAGYVFTADELNAAIEQYADETELSDDQLARVAGAGAGGYVKPRF